MASFNTLGAKQNGRHLPDDILNFLFTNLDYDFSEFVPKGPIDNIPALVQIMAWRPPGDKPLSEPKTVNLLTHVCLTRPQ